MKSIKVALAAACAVVVGWVFTASAKGYVWRGTDATNPTLASVAKNWAPEGVPGADDTVLLDASAESRNLEWDLDHGVANWTQTADYTGTVTFRTGRDGTTNDKVANKRNYYSAIGELDAGGTDKWFRVSGNVAILGGKWTHPAQPAFVDTDVACTNGLGIWRLLVKVGGNMEIGANASVDVSANGFPELKGPAHGTGSCSFGAGHGGSGGVWQTTYAPKPCYGSVKNPVCHGSGCGSPMSGGGAVRLDVAGELTLRGAIHADARNLNASGAVPQYYAASGGSVFITAGAIVGGGAISANGGEVTKNGAGAGGRISIRLSGDNATFDDFAVENLEALGRPGPGDGGGSKPQTAHSGTIYLETKAQEGEGLLWIRGTSATDTVIEQARGTQPGTGFNDPGDDYAFSEIRLDRCAMLALFPGVVVRTSAFTGDGTGYLACYGGQLQLPENYALTDLKVRIYNEGFPFAFAEGCSESVVLGTNCVLRADVPVTFPCDLHLLAGSKVYHTAGGSYKLDLTFEKDVVIDEGAAIDVTACGYAYDKGYAVGNVSGIGVATGTDGGGSHGGLGRASGTAKCYGSVTEPLEHGAGGHQQANSSGGGIVKMNVGGTLQVDGVIRSDGQEHIYNNTGYTAGAGGSINIRTGKLKGKGSVVANGGHGRDAKWGCGGGGRIAIRLADGAASFEPTPRVFARGGELADQRKTGGPGTVYLQTAAQGEGGGTLVIDNDGYTPEYGAAQFGQFVTCEGVGSVVITNCGSLKLSDATTLSFARDWTTTADSTFAAEAGTTVAAVGNETGRVLGTNAFCNFTCAVPGKTLRFGTADSLLTILSGGKLTLMGDDSADLTLTSDAAGETWPLALASGAVSTIEHVAVDHGDASFGSMSAVAIKSRDNGDNVNWTITGALEPGLPIVWVGTNSTEWGDIANWDVGRLPVETDVVTIPAAPFAPKLADDLTLNTVIVTGRLDLNGCTVTVTNDFTCSGALTAKGTERLSVGHALSLAGATLTGVPAVVSVGGASAQSADLGGHSLLRVELGDGSGVLSVTGGCRARELLVTPTGALQVAAGVSFDVDELVVRGSGATGLLCEGGAWSLKVRVGAFVSGVSVKNCDASAGRTVVADAPSADLGGNVNWTFLATGVALWTGAVDRSFETAGNWSTKAVPTEADRVVIPAGASVLASAEAVAVRALEVEGELHVATNLAVAGSVVVRDGGTLALDCPSTVGGTLTLRRGATLTHAANSSAELYALDLRVADDVEVEPGAKIDTTSCGLCGAYGPGKGIDMKAGATHGGRGGLWNSSTNINVCYDSIFAPVRVGSGSYFSNNGPRKAGGAVRLQTSGQLRLDGEILADAEQEALDSHYSASGGSVFLTAASFVGAGTVSAIGGRVTTGASGGGGRISLVQTEGTAWSADFTPTLRCHGGPVISGVGTRSAPYGSAGTIYRELAALGAGRGTILVDNAGASVDANRSYVELPASGEGSESAKELEGVTLVVQNGGVVSLTEDLTIEELELPRDAGKTTANVRVKLDGHTLTIRSHRHKDGKRGWPTNWNTAIFVPGTDADGNPGKVVWEPWGMMIMVK